MIEFITIITLILVAGMAGLAWVSKKRIDDLQDEVRALEHRVNNWEGCAVGGRFVPFDGALAGGAGLAILRKAGEE
jgi:hypothetical protein